MSLRIFERQLVTGHKVVVFKISTDLSEFNNIYKSSWFYVSWDLWVRFERWLGSSSPGKREKKSEDAHSMRGSLVANIRSLKGKILRVLLDKRNLNQHLHIIL